MATIKFLIRGESDTSSIYLRFKEGRIIDLTAKTKYLVNSENWSPKKGQPKNLKTEDLKQLNENLISLSEQLLKHYNASVNKNLTINSQWLRDFLNPQQNNDALPNKLSEYIDYYTLHKKNAIGSSTYKRNNVYKQMILRFEKSAKKVFLIKDVNADFKLKFEEYCEEQKYAHNTIARTVKFLKTVCRHARLNGIETNFQLDNISVKLKKVEKIYLSNEELRKIEVANYEFDYLENAKDWLIISCETGQRVSDFMRFKKEFIRLEDNVPLIEFTQVKTNKKMAIPLSKKVIAILGKRGGEFPRQISDQRYNAYIKEVCKIAGITYETRGSKIDANTQRKVTGEFPKYELVTSHIGRRSFATNNYGRIPTSLLINVTGHSSEGMFLEYIGKTETEKAKQLAEYF